MEEPDELQAMELQKSGTDLVTKQQQSLEKEWNSFWFEAKWFQSYCLVAKF